MSLKTASAKWTILWTKWTVHVVCNTRVDPHGPTMSIRFNLYTQSEINNKINCEINSEDFTVYIGFPKLRLNNI